MSQYDTPVVIFCGGRGSRMASLTEYMPKCLLPVDGFPLLWYVLHHFRSQGFRRFILPLGFGGKRIKNWVENAEAFSDCDFIMKDTGEDATQASRLSGVQEYLRGSECFYLANSDTISEFDLGQALKHHQSGPQAVTLLATPVVSSYGLIVKEAGKVVDFTRGDRVESVNIVGDSGARLGYVNSGFSIVDTDTFLHSICSLAEQLSDTYEHDFYGHLAREGKLDSLTMHEFWKAFDSKKDLDSIWEPSIAKKISDIQAYYQDAATNALDVSVQVKHSQASL